MHRLTSKGKGFFYLRAVLIVAFCWPALGYATSTAPPDAASIQSRMQDMIDFLDSPQYRQAVSWGEHVVLCYRLAQQRGPTIFEYYLLEALREDIGFPRSAVLSVALRAKEHSPSWDQCRNFIDRVNVSRFRTSQKTTDRAQKLAKTPRRAIIEILKNKAFADESSSAGKSSPAPQPQACVGYNIYFGYLHAHCELSDGKGTALEAYEFARDEGKLDFFALTDHGEYLIIWPWENKWQQLLDAAEKTYVPHAYATLYGFEWSNPVLGHLNIINTADFTSAISTFGLTKIYDWLIQRPEGFGRFNHPGDYDFIRLEHLHLKPYPDVVDQMVGIENYNGTDGFDQYYYSGSWWPFIPLSYWDVGNLRKWYLGSLGGQDNHSKHWGIRNEFRTAVLAEKLTRESIIDAYMNRRFYATEDKNLHLDFRCQGYPMGSRLSGVLREFSVQAWDDDSGDIFREVRLYRNGKLVETKSLPGQNFIEVVFSDPLFSRAAYYYVIVGQYDDNDENGRNDEAISSPIWIE
ncbi:MAG: CehA/McbA family metallohydrolase [Desulfobacterales bacterium]|jgi:hypothetical protein